ncbi:hypothetical protein FOZ62_001506, partial [Perkinsus olseni]
MSRDSSVSSSTAAAATTTAAAPPSSNRVILQPNRDAWGSRGEAANRVVRLVAAGGALKRNVRRKREPLSALPGTKSAVGGRTAAKRQKVAERSKTASLRRSPLRTGGRALEEEAMGEA